MTLQPPDLSGDDWRRIREALRYLGRDLHHRSFAVTAERRRLLWEEMDCCLALADRIAGLSDIADEGLDQDSGAGDRPPGCR